MLGKRLLTKIIYDPIVTSINETAVVLLCYISQNLLLITFSPFSTVPNLANSTSHVNVESTLPDYNSLASLDPPPSYESIIESPSLLRPKMSYSPARRRNSPPPSYDVPSESRSEERREDQQEETDA